MPWSTSPGAVGVDRVMTYSEYESGERSWIEVAGPCTNLRHSLNQKAPAELRPSRLWCTAPVHVRTNGSLHFIYHDHRCSLVLSKASTTLLPFAHRFVPFPLRWCRPSTPWLRSRGRFQGGLLHLTGSCQRVVIVGTNIEEI